MRRTAAVLTLLLTVIGCAPVSVSDSTPGAVTTAVVAPTTTTTLAATTTTNSAFPVTVDGQNGSVSIQSRPVSIVSLSPTATEMLFAVGAGEQVVAADEFSNYPDDAPTTSLSGFNPNIEAILSFAPDLVVAQWDPGELVTSLDAVDVPVLILPAAASLDDVYSQTMTLGVATGHQAEAEAVVSGMQAEIATLVEGSAAPEGLSVYHEADPTLYAASSFSFIGQLYGLLGLVNVADEADPDGFGFPQLSSEYLVAADPDFIFLADASLGVTAESLSERPGWSEMSAVQNGAVEVLDEDIASRWGPRVVDLLRSISDAVAEYALSS